MSQDSQLAAGLARDSGAGLAAVYDVYAQPLLNYAFTVLKNPTAAEEAVHDALLAASGAVQQLRDPEQFRPWLFALTRNECLRKLTPTRFSSDPETAAAISITADPAAVVQEGIGAMSQSDRDLLALVLHHGLTPEQVGLIEGRSVADLEPRVSAARVALSGAISAILLYRTRGRNCAQLAALLGPNDQPLTAKLREQIDSHAANCPVCSQERSAGLIAVGPVLASPAFFSPPPALRNRVADSQMRGQAYQLAERAKPFDERGFPVPLDSMVQRNWLLYAAVAALAVIIVVLVGALFLAQDSATTAGEASPSPTPSPSLSPTLSPSYSPSPSIPISSAPVTTDDPFTSDTTADPYEPYDPGPAPVVTTPAPAPTKTKTATPTPTKTKTPSPTTSSPTKSPTKSPTSTPSPTGTDVPAPVIKKVTLTDEDLNPDGTPARCDSFNLTVTAKVLGKVDKVKAKITPGGPKLTLEGKPFTATTTLTAGDYTVVVTATGPGGATVADPSTISHKCP